MLLDLKELLIKHKVKLNCVYHIGAHFGEEYTLFKECGADIIMMFEPLKSNFDVLKNKFLNNDDVILINNGLGYKKQSMEMYVEAENLGQSSSLLKPKIHLDLYPHITFGKKEVVEIDKLDNFNNENYNFISIDVQGYELEVFKGGLNTLKHIDAIITEVNRDDVYENCAKVEQLDRLLSFYKFERKNTNWVGGVWGDAFYVKN